MSKIDMQDTLVLDGVRRTADGYLTAFAKVARTGIQVYRGHEVGRPDLDRVRVYRPPSEVFSADAMRSLAHRPVTYKHPPVPVNSTNWKRFAGGQTGEDVVRDGDFVRVPMVMMDAAMVDAYERDGVRELSLGYSTDIKWTSGVVADGEPDAGKEYDAVQTAIRGNHLALVPVARGGDQLRVGDEEVDDAWSDAAREAAARARAAHKKGDAREVAKAFRDHLKAEGIKASMFKESQPELNTETHEVNFQYSASNLKKAEKIAKSHPGISPNSYTDPGEGGSGPSNRSYFYTHDYTHPLRSLVRRNAKDAAHFADGTCPECGAEMQGKTCPECNYVKDGEENMKILMLDGLSVSLADDQSASIVQRVVDGLTAQLKQTNDALEDLKKKKGDADKEMADAKTTISAKDGEILVLKKQITDAEITPAKLDVLVKDRLSVIDSASKILPKEFSYDGKTLADIRRATVTAKLGDAAVKPMDDAAIGGAFAALCAGAADNGGSRQIADAFAARPHGAGATQVSDAYEGYRKSLENNWKPAA